MERVAEWFDRAVKSAEDEAALAAIAAEVKRPLADYPAPGLLT